MKERKIKKEKGITLVALIITIIIMLILVGVSINILIKSDLLGAAQRAADKTRTAYEEEEGKMGEITIGNKTYSSIDEYMKENEKEEHNWFYVDETTRAQIRCECAECKAYDDGDSTGRTLSVGQQIYYTKTGTGSTTISAEKSGIAAAKADYKSWATNYGDYQTVTLTGETIWVVFGYEDRDNNGTNETLLLTTKEPTEDTVRLYGAAAYNYGPEEINRMCRELYGEDARGMRIEDINRALGYTAPEAKKLKDTDNWSQILSEMSLKGYAYFYDPAHPEGIKDGGAALGEYITGHYYLGDRISPSLAVPVLGTTFGEQAQYCYWLSFSGCMPANSMVFFGPARAEEGRIDYAADCLTSYSGENFEEYSLRSIMRVQSVIPPGGDVLLVEFSGSIPYDWPVGLPPNS